MHCYYYSIYVFEPSAMADFVALDLDLLFNATSKRLAVSFPKDGKDLFSTSSDSCCFEMGSGFWQEMDSLLLLESDSVKEVWFGAFFEFFLLTKRASLLLMSRGKSSVLFCNSTVTFDLQFDSSALFDTIREIGIPFRVTTSDSLLSIKVGNFASQE